MNYIIITDIFGNKISQNKDINDNLPFILIHCYRPNVILENVSIHCENQLSDSIWELKSSTVYHILFLNNITGYNFKPLGDIWFPNNKLPSKISILMTNSNNNIISEYPIDFVKIDNYIDVCIWKPICPNNYRELGLVASQSKPSVRSIKVINYKFLKEYCKETRVKDRNTNMNEYNFLSNIEIKKFTIDKVKLSQYLNNSSPNENTDNYIIQQKFLNLSDHENSEVESTLSCSSSKLCSGVSNQCQKWYVSESNSSSSDQIKTRPLESKEHLDSSYSLDPSNLSDLWKPQKGKKVLLMEPEITWYSIKKKQFSPPPKKIFQKNNEHDITRNNINTTKNEYNKNNNSDNDKKNEKINSKFKFDFNMIACSLLLLIFLLVIIRYYLNKKM